MVITYTIVWTLGSFICKTVSYMQGVSVSASVNTLMAISIERCIAISTPYCQITTRYVPAYHFCPCSLNQLYDFFYGIVWKTLFCSVHSSHARRHYRVTVTIIWMIATLVNLPWLYVFQLEPIELGSNRKVSRNILIESKTK